MAINASLMTLGRCLEALRWNQQHPAAEQRLVPYREARVGAPPPSQQASVHADAPSTKCIFLKCKLHGQQHM